jgi:hypothetical protein
MHFSKFTRVASIAGFVAAFSAANAYFVPVTVSGTATGSFAGTTNGFSYAPGAPIDGSLQFEDTSSQFSGSVGYYGISPVLNSGTFGDVTLIAPITGTQVYSGSLAVDITFVSPTNTSQVYTATVTGSITGAILSGKHAAPAKGGVTISFGTTPITFYYGDHDSQWFSLELNPITFGPKGGTQAITGYGETYASTPAPAGALVFLVGALRRRRNRA